LLISGAIAVSASDLSSAQIIPFPVRPFPAPKPVKPDAARLARALAALDTAIAEQRIAMAAWRDSLAALRVSTTALVASAAHYHGSLDVLGADVMALNGQARALERWADDVLAREPG
jgi:hypothetical protein